METRQITQVKIYELVMNPMRGNAESAQCVAIAYDRQKLIDWYNSQLTGSYEDEGSPSFECHGNSHTWHKSFTKGSRLEWFNPIDNFDTIGTFGHGIHTTWINDDVNLPSDLLV